MPYVRPHIAALQGYTPGEQPQGGKFIKLNTNENPYPPSPAVGHALAASWERGLERYPDPLATSFRLRAADVLGVPADWILCGNGSDDILTILTRALVGEGDVLRLPYPSYVLYRTLAEIQHATAEEVKFDSNWRLPTAFGLGSNRLRLVFLPNPNSPSGTVLPPEDILAFAEQLPCPLLVDEAYVDFADSHSLELVAKCERIMVSRTLSKSYALAGLRFGFLVAQPQLIDQFRKVKDSYNCDALSIAAATAAIGDQAWLAQNRAKVLATRVRLTEAMRSRGFLVPDSHANFVWCTRPDRAPLKPVYEQLKERGVLVRYMHYADWGEGLRVSVGSDAQIDAFFTQLDSILAQSAL